METPLQITFRGMESSDAVKANIEERVAKLERIYDRITNCNVVVELPHRHRTKGKIFHIGITLSVPGGDIVVKRSPEENYAHEDIYVALRDSFRSVRRQLEDFVRRQRRDVKTHEPVPYARVVRMFPEEDYGFLETPDGREIYFHRNSVIDGYDRLEVGSEVRYVEEKGEEGPQASTVATI